MSKKAKEVLEGAFSAQQQPQKKSVMMPAKRKIIDAMVEDKYGTSKKTKTMAARRTSGPVQGERYDAPVTKPAVKAKGAWTQAQKEQAMRERRAAAQAAGKTANGAWGKAEKEAAMRERRAAAMAKKGRR